MMMTSRATTSRATRTSWTSRRQPSSWDRGRRDAAAGRSVAATPIVRGHLEEADVIHVVTVHYQSDQWIDVQLEYLARHLQEPYQVWANLEGVAPEHDAKFDVVV